MSEIPENWLGSLGTAPHLSPIVGRLLMLALLVIQSTIEAAAPAAHPACLGPHAGLMARWISELSRPELLEAFDALTKAQRRGLLAELRERRERKAPAVTGACNAAGARFNQSHLRKSRVIVTDPERSKTDGDDRSPLTGRERALFEAVGIIEGKGFQGGTAALVGDCRTVVTAAHTIAGASSLRTDDVAFLAQGDPEQEYPVDWYDSLLPPPRGFLERGGIELDVAVLGLKRPVENCKPLGYATLRNADLKSMGESIYSVAFHRDTGRDAVIHRNCAIANGTVDRGRFIGSGYKLDPKGVQDEVLLHHCDTGPGSSGSPLMIFMGETPYVIGINTGAPSRKSHANDPLKSARDQFLPESLKNPYPNHGVLFTESAPVVRALDRRLGR